MGGLHVAVSYWSFLNFISVDLTLLTLLGMMQDVVCRPDKRTQVRKSTRKGIQTYNQTSQAVCPGRWALLPYIANLLEQMLLFTTPANIVHTPFTPLLFHFHRQMPKRLTSDFIPCKNILFLYFLYVIHLIFYNILCCANQSCQNYLFVREARG